MKKITLSALLLILFNLANANTPLVNTLSVDHFQQASDGNEWLFLGLILVLIGCKKTNIYR